MRRPSFYLRNLEDGFYLNFKSLFFIRLCQLKKDGSLIYYWIPKGFYIKIIEFKDKIFQQKPDYERWNSKSGMTIIKSSFDAHIQEKGGIVDNMGNVHTTAHSYKTHLKDNNLVVKDWTQGTLKKPELKRCEASDVLKAIKSINSN